jgi:hypothetical protein
MSVFLKWLDLMYFLVLIILFSSGCTKNQKQEVENSSNFRLETYPNPVTVRVNFFINYNRSQPGTLKVFDSKAEKIAEFEIEANAGNKNYAVDLENKPLGLYQVVLESGDTFLRKSFLKTE